jgi:ABC-type lipoprotein export system ATPase subunit
MVLLQSVPGVWSTQYEIVLEGTTLLVATHDPRVAGRMRRIIHMRDGAIGTDPN